jgi:hypothetical protein
MSKFLRFTDHEGDPLALTPDIDAVYCTSTKDTLASFPGQVVREVKSEEFRVLHHRTGSYRVQDTFDEVMTKLDKAGLPECE